MTISPKVQSVVSKALFAAILAGSAMAVGCGSADGESEQAPAPSAVEDTGRSTSALQTSLSAVTCSGDQNNGGRICCDATHCCINIGGVINCSPRQATMN